MTYLISFNRILRIEPIENGFVLTYEKDYKPVRFELENEDKIKTNGSN
jgi:hypothetical protein